MKNNLRNWIHYILARTKDGVQKEHREVALLIRDIVKEQFPITSRALVF
jgi:thymidylate synthase ThyX